MSYQHRLHLEFLSFTPWKSSQAWKNALHTGSSHCTSGAEVWLSQHSNQAFTLDFKTANRTTCAKCSCISLRCCPATREGRDSSPRTPLTVTELSLVSLCLSKPHILPKGSSCSDRTHTDCAGSQAVQLGQKCQELEKLEDF